MKLYAAVRPRTYRQLVIKKRQMENGVGGGESEGPDELEENGGGEDEVRIREYQIFQFVIVIDSTHFLGNRLSYTI